MMCEDCQFELGIDEYEYSYRNNRFHYECSVCATIVPQRVYDNAEERMIGYITMKEKRIQKEREYLPITWVTFKRNCRHYLKEELPKKRGLFKPSKEERYIERCYYRINQSKRPYTTIEGNIPEICKSMDCPIFEWYRIHGSVLYGHDIS